jgi:hypothetical protein
MAVALFWIGILFQLFSIRTFLTALICVIFIALVSALLRLAWFAPYIKHTRELFRPMQGIKNCA